MKKTILILFLAFGTALYAESLYVYPTYANYEKDSAETYDEYLGWLSSGGVTINAKKDGKKCGVKCKNIWGFKIGEHLFRVDRRWNIPVKLVSCDGVCKYENGIIWLKIISIGGTFDDYSDFLWASDSFPY